MERRDFLQMLGLFSGTAALSACGSDKNQKKLISLLVPPEEGVIPGEAVWTPSVCTECPVGCSMQVRTREGWPVKLEGTAGHPLNDGALCPRGQASLARLYRERLTTPLRRTANGSLQPASWEEALAAIDQALTAETAAGRQGVYLSGATSGTLEETIKGFCQARGLRQTPTWEPLSQAPLRQAYAALFGVADLPDYAIDRADFLLTVGADIVETFGNPVAQTHRLSQARERADFHWWHLEPGRSLSGARAGVRLNLRPDSEALLLAWLLQQRLAGGVPRPLPSDYRNRMSPLRQEDVAAATGLPVSRLQELAERLATAERPLLIVGGVSIAGTQGVQAALYGGLLQWCCGMVGETIDFTRPAGLAAVGGLRDLDRLARDLAAEQVGVLWISRTDPLGTLPAEHPLTAAVAKAGLRVGLGDHLTPTLAACDWVLPLCHPLESWGDAAHAATLSLLKPAVAPAAGCRAEGEILLQLQGAASGWQETLFTRWKARLTPSQLERFSRDGYVALPQRRDGVYLERSGAKLLLPPALPVVDGPQLLVVPSVRGYDGRSYDLPLLQEIPDPLTTTTWEPWVSVSPALAALHGLRDRALVRLTLATGELTLPVKVQPGLAETVLQIQQGLLPQAVGRAAVAEHGEWSPWLAIKTLAATGETAPLPILSGSPSQHGRGLIPDPVHLEAEHDGHGKHPSAYPDHAYPDYLWGLAIDLDKCVGCSACVAACYVENAVAVVGPKEHLKGREMSWLRIEPYYDEAGEAAFLPMLCQQCQKAPCEPVCPVYAAVHNNEGLNLQVYNRCVGTRYCANNCPYKVRRFNWFDHIPTGPEARMRNPDLAPRTKGMMEKCTFCLQRIRSAKDTAKDEGRLVRDGECTTACAQTCPAGAITFGNLKDPDSAVAQLAKDPRAYHVFDELGTGSSVFYLKPKMHSR